MTNNKNFYGQNYLLFDDDTGVYVSPAELDVDDEEYKNLVKQAFEWSTTLASYYPPTPRPAFKTPNGRRVYAA